MYQTRFGAFNGRSWEDLCQQIFKIKYAGEGYLAMPASPGDFGIEGYTAHTGLAFQCYCPERQCTTAELYESQRDKITNDLRKLRENIVELERRLGATKICEWNFVSPTINKNELLRHAKTKESEVKSWGLPIISPNFTVLLKDGEFYQREINEIHTLNGRLLNFDPVPPQIPDLSANFSEYETNIRRKSEIRVGNVVNAPKRANILAQSTTQSFLQGAPHLQRIESTAPTIYLSLARLVREFELYVQEASATWSGSPEELTAKLRDELEKRILQDLGEKIDGTTSAQVARQMIARWLAVCQLDFE
jgi:hypothetical protein